MESERCKELDALRGLAALMVVLFHITMGRPEKELGFKLGTTGVDLFFVISGFVIYMSLANSKNTSDFVINRISRLYPTYWTCVTLTFITLSVYSFYKLEHHFSPDYRVYLGNMTMFQFYLKIPDIDGPYWTMIVEMIFYIVVAILSFLKKLKYWKVIGVFLSGTLAIIFSTSPETFPTEPVKFIPLLQFIPLFTAGSIFYEIFISKRSLLINYFLISICFVSQVILFNNSGRSALFITQTQYALMLVLYFTFFILLVHGRLKFIVSKSTLFLGKISFSLYLIHQSLSRDFIIPFFTKFFHMNFLTTAIFACIPILLLLSSCITFYIEIPMNKLMRNKLKRIIVPPAKKLV